jgi:hypothetical protein
VHRDLKLENLLLVKKKDISHIKIAGADSSFTAAQLLARWHHKARGSAAQQSAAWA